jgi:sugar (pentulose or hexulose) kinase
MEGIAMALRKALDILLGQVKPSGNMLMCGGGSKSPVWLRMFADIYNLPVLKTNIDQNAASLGAAAIAANACGIWNGYDIIASIHKTQSLIYPDKEANEKYEKLLKIYSVWTEDLAKLGEMMNQINC